MLYNHLLKTSFMKKLFSFLCFVFALSIVNATSVDSAVTILKNYNLHVPHGQGNYHFYMADASGRHAVEHVFDLNMGKIISKDKK